MFVPAENISYRIQFDSLVTNLSGGDKLIISKRNRTIELRHLTLPRTTMNYYGLN